MKRQHKNETVTGSTHDRPSSVSGNAETPNFYMNGKELNASIITEEKGSNPKRNVQKAVVKPIIQTKPVIKDEKDKKKADNTNVKPNAVYENTVIKHPKVKQAVVSTAKPSEEKTEESIYYNEVTFVNNPIKLDDLVDRVTEMKTKTDSFKVEYEVNVNINMR